MARIAIIGSFRQHYEEIRQALREFNEAGHEVTSPLGTEISEHREFVRFESDPSHWDDAMVQTVTLHRILRADVVYVCSPGGYVGKTTCYEIGRVVQAGHPIYFSEHPQDLPIAVDNDLVGPPQYLCSELHEGKVRPLFEGGGDLAHLERRLAAGDFSDA
jgi:hypothetical protein